VLNCLGTASYRCRVRSATTRIRAWKCRFQRPGNGSATRWTTWACSITRRCTSRCGAGLQP